MPSGSDVSSFLRDTRWKARFEDEILAAAQPLVSKVKGLKLEEPVPGSFNLLGSVAKDETEIGLWQSPSGDWEFESYCSCEVGGFCHHAAAMMLRAGKERDLSRLGGHSVAEAVAAALPQSPVAAPPPPPELPRLSPEPGFELHVTREPVDRTSKLLLQSLGQPEPDFWISAEATVNYGGHRGPLRASMPDWTSRVIQPDGSPALLEHRMAAENAAARDLADTGLSSLQSNSAWRFLLNLKSRETKHATPRDRWFPDPSRIPVDLFWHQFRGEWIAKLEESGWTVTVDDNVGHRVFDADPAQWESSLTPQTGGWFSLSVGFDVAGVRHDLLPILAELLEGGHP